MIESREFCLVNIQPKVARDWKDGVLDELAKELVRRVIVQTEEAWKSLSLLEWGQAVLKAYFRLPPY